MVQKNKLFMTVVGAFNIDDVDEISVIPIYNAPNTLSLKINVPIKW